jgi:signal transduction histidine kinase/ActR/RegA family two-component response regulator
MNAAFDERVLVVAPTGRDGRLLEVTLEQAAIQCQACASINDLCDKAREGAGALFIAEEALTEDGIECVSRVVTEQPPWSDIPVIVSTGKGATTEERVRNLESISIHGNVVVLERPVRILTMLVTVQSSLRARRRQYQTRNLMTQLEKERANAERANRAKDEFLAMLGHELRNPLAPIITALELMRMREGQSVTHERQVIERQARHMAGLVSDLLDVSRITRGSLALKRTVVDIGELLGRAVETAAPLFEQRRQELTTQLGERPLFVDGDPARLTQVFSNLLTNAAKYTDDGGKISIAVTEDEGQVLVRVTDTGRGISSRMLPRIFDLFTQEHQNLDRSQGGLGLGLAIVKNLVEVHGGTVSATSRGNGRGSTFEVRLPSVAEPIWRDVEVEAVEPASAVARHSILVVDDNQDAAELLAETLALSGYAPRVAHDAAEALHLAQQGPPVAVALLDIGLPVMDGYELARRLRALPGWDATWLVAVTGYGQESDRRLSSEAGFDAHLIKPIERAMLDRILADAELNNDAVKPD